MPRSLIGVITLAATVAFSMRTCLWMARVREAQRSREVDAPASNSSHKHVVLVPVLDESKRIPSLIAYFKNLHDADALLRLVLISSSRDRLSSRDESTPALCANAAGAHDWVSHVHVNDPGGTMASQLNAAFRAATLIDDDDLVAIYNADSRPHPASLRESCSLLSSRSENVVVQQHGLYVRNLDGIARRRGPARTILLAAAAWQTRWSMGFERHHATLNASGSFGALRGFSYVVGHGLFIRGRLMREAGGFTERFSNEDAHLSLVLAMRNVQVIPHPRWEIADSPDTVRALVGQKRVWFGGPAHAWSYRRDIVADGPAVASRLSWASLALFNHAVCWLGGPLAGFGLMVISCVRGHPREALALCGAVAAYIAAPNFVALRFAASESGRDLSSGAAARVAIGALPMYFLHGFSAVLGVIHVARESISGRRLAKPKTAMRHVGQDA